MTTVVTADTPEGKRVMRAFLAEHGVNFTPNEDFYGFGTIGSDTKTLRSVVAINWIAGRVGTMHVAGDGRWLNRSLLWRTFDFIFRRCGAEAIIVPIAADNEASLRFTKHIGFREIYRVRDGWAIGTDLVFLQMLRSECPWVEKFDARFLN